MKKLWNKIKPLDYTNSPNGSFKVEIMFHLSYLVLLAYISGTTFIINNVYIDKVFEILFEIVFLLMLISWIRIASVINKFKPI